MTTLLTSFVFLAALSAATAKQLRGDHFFDDAKSDDSDSADHGDFMDAYIKKSSNAGVGGSVWYNDEKAAKKDVEPLEVEHKDGEDVMKAGKKDVNPFAADQHDWEAVTERANEEVNSQAAKDPMDKVHEEATSHNAPSAETPMMASVSSSASDDAGTSGESQQNTEPTTVNVSLDSELQMALLQGQGRLRAVSKSRSAPNVEETVAKERMEDVYIHDEFTNAAAEDTKEESEVNASKDLKA